MVIMCVTQYLLNEHVLSRQVEYRQWMELISSCNFYHRVQEGCIKKTREGDCNYFVRSK